MEAFGATRDVRAQAFPPSAPSARLGQTVVASSFALVASAGLLLCVRRLGGALAEPLAPAALVPVAACLASAALVFRGVFASAVVRVRDRVFLWAMPSIALALWALGLTLPGSGAWGMALFCGILLVEEGWSWGRFRGQLSATPSPAAAPSPAPTMSGRIDLLQADRIHHVADEMPEYDEAVSQHVVRRRDESGEVLQGWVRVEFLPAQRIAAAHLAICPPSNEPRPARPSSKTARHRKSR